MKFVENLKIVSTYNKIIALYLIKFAIKLVTNFGNWDKLLGIFIAK
jgi:hypothetical protein